jgi:predicted transcriptional regulator
MLIDPYRILHQYGITHPAQQHAIKKLLRAGRSHKQLRKDIQEIIQTLERWLEMLNQDEGKPPC